MRNPATVKLDITRLKNLGFSDYFIDLLLKTGGGSALPTGGIEGDVLTIDENGDAVWLAPSPPLSPEVQVAIAYAALVGLDSDGRQAAIDLANAQLENGYRDKIVAMYIFKAGTTLDQKVYNFVDPTEFGKALAQAVPANGNVAPVANANGILLGNNWSSEIVIPYLPTDIVGAPYIGIGMVQPNAKDMQFYNNAANNIGLLIDGPDIYNSIGNAAGGLQAGGATNRLKPFWQRIDSNTIEFYHAGIKVYDVARSFDFMAANQVVFFYRNNGTPETISAIYMTKELTEAEAGFLSADLDAFLNAL